MRRLRLTFLSLALLTTSGQAQVVHEPLWVADNTVNAVEVANGKAYLGGYFRRIGPAVGSFVGIDTAGTLLQPFPSVVGSVLCLAPDGSGGWYIGGDFSGVQGQPRERLAHLDAAGNVTPWNPGADGTVFAIHLYGTTLYVGGNFTRLGGELRFHLGSVDATTGVVSLWNPHPGGSFPQVYAIASHSSTTAGSSRIYVGGSFTEMVGLPRANLAAFDPDNSNLLTSWNPNADAAVTALAVRTPRFGTPTVYVGGIFENLGGQPRARIASVDANTGALGSWNPGADAVVRSIHPIGPVYVAGEFNNIGGQPRPRLAALDLASGAATSWNPGPDARVNGVLSYAGRIYVAGWFSTIGGQARRGLAALDPVTASATSWNPDPNGLPQVIGANEKGVVVGGYFTSLGGVTRNGLAAIDLASGLPTSWDPDVGYGGSGGNVQAMTRRGGTLYVGGTFDAIGGQTRKGLAAIDLVTGAPTAWNPDATNASIGCMLGDGNTIYVGGFFSSIGGLARNYVAAIDAETGIPATWAPTVSGYGQEFLGVKAIAVSGSTVYIGGDFTGVNGQTRTGLAAIHTPSGVLEAFNPNPTWSSSGGVIRDILVDGGTVVVGGSFDRIGGRGRNNLAILDAATGLATVLDPYTNTDVNALEVDGTTLYVGGWYTTLGLQTRPSLAALDLVTGYVTSWNPIASGPVMALARDPNRIYAGGGFVGIGYRARSCFAGMSELTVGVESEHASASGLRAWPNPFRDEIALRLAAGTSRSFELDIFDCAGRRVRRYRDRPSTSGEYSVTWDGRNDAGEIVQAGLYLIRARAGATMFKAKILRVN